MTPELLNSGISITLLRRIKNIKKQNQKTLFVLSCYNIKFIMVCLSIYRFFVRDVLKNNKNLSKRQ